MRLHPNDTWALTLRGDVFAERTASGASPVFWSGAGLVGSATATVEVRPHPHLSVRLEYRHDAADAPLFFSGAVPGDGSAAAPHLPNARSQDTVLLGATASL